MVWIFRARRGGRGGLWNKINLKIPGVVLGREGGGGGRGGFNKF